jgi:2-polyprenyl-3-methyl-5-hydroxy-6-metoxy-1,4-benzoquinol methylase
VKYEGIVDLSNRNSSQVFAVEMIGGNKRVLEFGCASGYVSRVLRDRGCQVVGIEIDPEFASEAKEFCEDVIIGNAEDLDLESILAERSFDVAVFGDVLEHLSDPLAILRRVRQWLVPDGYVVASLPNIAHGAVRLALLEGRFDYTPEGLLDETHLRFFTHDTIKELFHQAGFVVVETRRTHVGIFESEIPVRREDFDPEVVARIEADHDATTYQFVVKALVDNALSAAEAVHEREEAQRIEILDLRAGLERADADVARLQAALEMSESDRTATREALDRAVNEMAALRAELAAREDAVANYEAFMARFERRWPVRVYRRLKALSGGS